MTDETPSVKNMATCLDCARAKWQRTKNEKLHPSGDGRCEWKMGRIQMPKAFQWGVFSSIQPQPHGGYINRHKPYLYCPLFCSKEIKP